MGSAAMGVIDELVGAGARFGEAFRKEMEVDGPIDTRGRRGEMARVIQGLQGAIESSEQTTKEEGKKAGAEVPGEAELGASMRLVRPIVSSLAKVGGAMGSGVIRIDLDKERNGLLKRIERNTRRGEPVARFA